VTPVRWIVAKSRGRVSMTRRGRQWPRSRLRPSSAASGLEPAERPEHAGHRSSSSGPGSRVPLRGGASWAGRSASSGLCAILSIRPRGLGFRPLEARERAVRPMALGASSFGGL
jgi:hypothetical protein